MHFAAPLLAVLAAVGPMVEAKRYTCDRKQYADVAHRIGNPAFFCKFWLAEKRTGSQTPLSPFYGVRSLTKLCRCFVQNSPRVRGPYKPLRPKPLPSGCPITMYRPLKNQYKNPNQFCRWYVAIGGRKLSPLPSMTDPKAVYKACRCFLNQNFAPQQTTTPAPEPEPTTTPAETTPSTTPEETTSTTTTTSEIGGGVQTSLSSLLTTTTTTSDILPSLPTIIPTTTTTTTSVEQTTTAAATTEFTSTGAATSTGSATSSGTSSI